MKNIILLTLGIIIILAVFQAVQFGWRVKIGKNLVKQAQSFSHSSENPATRILIVGDSTAYGTGAATPSQSTAGWFHQDFPKAEIVNISKNGSKLVEARGLLNSAEGKFDLVLIQAGANNIIRFGSLKNATVQANTLLKDAKKYSGNIIWLVSGNIGAAPIWFWPANWIYTYRSRKFLAAFEKIAEQNNVVFVNLFQEKKDDVFINDVAKYYATDLLHLSGEGYRSWYQQIRKTMSDNNINL